MTRPPWVPKKTRTKKPDRRHDQVSDEKIQDVLRSMKERNPELYNKLYKDKDWRFGEAPVLRQKQRKLASKIDSRYAGRKKAKLKDPNA